MFDQSRITRAAELSPGKRAKLTAEAHDAAYAVARALQDAYVLADDLGQSHPDTLDAFKAVSELGLTIGRRTRILAGLPRGG